MRTCVLVHPDKLLRPLCILKQFVLEEGMRDLATFNFVRDLGLMMHN